MEGRLYRFSDYLRLRYPFKVWKLPVDAGFTCPNRDGTKGWGGCTYCDNRSFSPPARDRAVELRRQIEHGLVRRRRSGPGRAIVYFQAYTNTYGAIDELRRLYDTALAFPEVVGLAIATRPDCLPEGVLDLLSEMTRRTGVWLEIGVETTHDAILASLNRAHTVADVEDAVRRARGRGFEIVGHLIFGLPGETRAMMLETVRRVSELGLDAVKLHHFYVAKATPLEKAFHRGEIQVLTFPEWIELAADVVERLPASLYIERAAGELSNEWLVAPRWGKSGTEVWAAIEAELERRGSRQGNVSACGRHSVEVRHGDVPQV
ncbi:MAG: TIGR01212 family radical SAM protein [Planctomycetes bacterium]|nr:TIGR01212 family radical SAM protein [Planctomycetota bacterium]